MKGGVRGHPLLRNLAKSALVAASTASVGLNLVAFERLRGGSLLGLEFDHLFQFVLLLGALLVLFLKETGHRSGGWALGLPVGARELWTDHAKALLAAVGVIFLAQAVIVVGFSRLIGLLSGSDLLGMGPLLGHFLRPGAVLVALALALAAWRPALADPESAAGWTRFRLALAAAAAALLAGLVLLPAAWSALPVAAAAAAAWRARASVPPALILTEARHDAGSGPATHHRSAGALHHLILRQLFKWPVTWILGLPMVALLGLIIGGVANGHEDADFAQFFNLWITVYLLVAFFMHFLENLGRVDHLPVPRGLLLRWLLVPGIATVVCGGVAGSLIDNARREPTEALVFSAGNAEGRPTLRVPPDAWTPVWGDPPAAITAPWGETVVPASIEVIRGLPLRLWKPYTTGANSSAEFVAWQISRAVAGIHGATVPADLIRERYLAVDETGLVTVREPGLTLVGDGLVPPRGPIGPVLPLLLGVVIVGTLLVSWSIFRPLGPGVTRRRVRAVFWTHMVALIALHLGGYGLLMTRRVFEWPVAGLVRGWAADLASLGVAGWILPWLAILLLAWPAWRLCARAFARVEAIRPGPGSCSW